MAKFSKKQRKVQRKEKIVREQQKRGIEKGTKRTPTNAEIRQMVIEQLFLTGGKFRVVLEQLARRKRKTKRRLRTTDVLILQEKAKEIISQIERQEQFLKEVIATVRRDPKGIEKLLVNNIKTSNSKYC